ncbi:YqzE-like protein [Evansella caseinilytica]|uniref:YqzE-like protein n=1 Tax=Evansella caseinilytica TaxID=1503961 RepID=A0A1H3KUM9_9BACI|nr:YqzE family protein [Evansella caseinilytica]SDY55355.1 YqzE-like protein [Evansella caseinilytica]
MKPNDYVKYLTQQFVTYVDLPKEERQARREEKRLLRPPKAYRLFGLIPFAVSQALRRLKDENAD